MGTFWGVYNKVDVFYVRCTSIVIPKVSKMCSVYTNLEFLKKNVKEKSNEYSCKGICLMVHTVLQYKKTCWKNLIVKEYLEIE